MQGARAGVRLSDGVSLGTLGVSLTAVTQAGVPLEASGVMDGASVFYGDSEDQQAGIMDLDSLVKFDPHGFRLDSLLRSDRAPSKLYYQVGLPPGATLTAEGAGGAVVVVAGRPVALIATGAEDAEGTTVPVSVSVQGDLLVLSVEHPAGEYRMPIEVDPTVSEGHAMGRYEMGQYWEFEAESPRGVFSNYEPKYGVHGMDDQTSASGEDAPGEYGVFGYETQGQSRIYKFVSRSFDKNSAGITSTVYIAGRGGVESAVQAAGSENTVCLAEGCPAPIGDEINWENGAFYKQAAISKEWDAFEDILLEATEYVVQEKGPSVSGWNSCGTNWTNAETCKLELKATDPGLGLNEVAFSSPSSGSWKSREERCYTIQCNQKLSALQSLTGLPEGEDTVKGTFTDPVGLTASSERVVKIDNAAPHSLSLSGLGPGNQVGPGEYQLKVEATDGSGSTLSSGIASISLWIDGREVDSSSVGCPLGPCTVHSPTWPIFGHSYATGRHTVTIVATDKAGNVATEKLTMTVHPASPVALGPGSVNSGSGELSLAATDVSMPGGLTVGRSYGSQSLTGGVGGPVGPQWGLSLGGMESLIKQADGSMVLIEGSGAQTIFAPNGSGGYVSPAGDANLTLSTTPCEAGQTEFMLKDAAANTTTCFKVPSGGTGEVWSPNITQGAVATDTVTYSYETVEVPSGSKKMITRPKESLAPVPAGVSCSPELKAGCRALTFNYATSTTAKGEALAEWGDYEGDLTRIYYTAWDPVSKGMKKVEVAHYLYDGKGRLRTVWDPRIAEPLKTYYGYDSEGHVTALTSPGQETWAFVYGPMAGSSTSGVVLKALQEPPAEGVWSGASLTNTAAPEVTGIGTTGVRMAVSNGKWSGGPVLYGYQWEDCNVLGLECVAIPDATNANYVPGSKDVGHRLAAVVTATNGSGSVGVTALASTLVPTFLSSFGSYGTGPGKLREPADLKVDASGNVWVADSQNHRVQEFNSKGEFVRAIGSEGTGNGQFSGSVMGVAIDSKGNIWVTDSSSNRIEEFSPEGVFIKAIGSGGSGSEQFWVPEGLAFDSTGDLYVADRGNNRVEEFDPEGKYLKSITKIGNVEANEGPSDVVLDSSGNIWISLISESKIQEYSPSGTLLRSFGTKGVRTWPVECARAVHDRPRRRHLDR